MDAEFRSAGIAIYTGDVDELERLLAEDPGLATRKSSVSHPTLLQLIACEAGNLNNPVASAEVLIEAGAVTHGPLVAAAGCDSRSVLEFFLERGLSVNGEDANWSPLDEALYWGNDEVVEMLMSRGAKIRALSTAACLGDLLALDSFLIKGEPAANAGPIGSPFTDTVSDSQANDPTAIINHAFVSAVNCGQRDAAAKLLEIGADVNAKPPGFHWHGTALHAAVQRGDLELVNWLLTQGADPLIRDGMVDADALGWAHYHQHSALVAVLTSS